MNLLKKEKQFELFLFKIHYVLILDYKTFDGGFLF